MKRSLLALATLALAACATAPAPSAPPPEPPSAAAPVDAFALHIEIGRYGAMLSQVGEYQPDNSLEIPVSAPLYLAAVLRETVWKYNAARSRLCRNDALSALTCGPAYAPDWLGENPEAPPRLSVLQARSDEVGAQVMALWNAACEEMDADKPRTPDGIILVEDRSCPME